MMQKQLFLYYWICFDKRRIVQSGRVWAADSDALVSRFARGGFLPITIRYSYWMYFYPAWWWQQWVWLQSRERLSLAQVAFFCRNVQALISGGLSFFAAVQVCAATATEVQLRSAVADAVVYINRGIAPGDAFGMVVGRWPSVVPLVLSAAQGTGAFGEILIYLADAFEREVAYRRDIARAALLPAVTGLGAFCVLGWAAYLCADQSGVAGGFGSVVGIINWSSDYGLHATLILLVVLYACWRLLSRLKRLRALWDRIVLRLPLVGPLTARAHAILFFTMLALLLRAHIPVVEALRAIRPLFANTYWRQTIDDLVGRLMQGNSLSVAMEASPRVCIPALFVATLPSATEAQLLAAVCQNMAGLLIRERSHLMDRYVALLQPALMAIVGVAIAGFLYLMYQSFSQSLGATGLI